MFAYGRARGRLRVAFIFRAITNRGRRVRGPAGPRPPAIRAVKVEHVPTESNRADLLTKALTHEAFCRHRAALMDVRE